MGASSSGAILRPSMSEEQLEMVRETIRLLNADNLDGLWFAHRFREGRIVEIRWFWERGDALTAAGAEGG